MKEVKKYLLILFAVAVPLALATGCKNSKNDDDDDDPNLTLSEAIEGVYKSTYTTEEWGEGEVVVTLTKTAEKQITISIGEISFPELVSFKLPNITAIPLTGKTSAVGMVKSEDNVSVSGTAGESDIAFRASYQMTGTVKRKTKLRLEIINFSPDLNILDEYSPFTIVIEGDKEEDEEE